MSLPFLVDGLETFTQFLRTEFSEENIEFWMACEDFKKSKDPQQMILKAKAIYEKFIQNDAPQEVNIPGKMYNCSIIWGENLPSSNWRLPAYIPPERPGFAEAEWIFLDF